MPEYEITALNRVIGKRVEIVSSETTVTIKTPKVTVVCSENGSIAIDAPGGIKIDAEDGIAIVASSVDVTGKMHVTGDISTDRNIRAEGDIKAGGAILPGQ
jgi:GTPase Era involved in 16S rRNA processing